MQNFFYPCFPTIICVSRLSPHSPSFSSVALLPSPKTVSGKTHAVLEMRPLWCHKETALFLSLSKQVQASTKRQSKQDASTKRLLFFAGCSKHRVKRCVSFPLWSGTFKSKQWGRWSAQITHLLRIVLHLMTFCPASLFSNMDTLGALRGDGCIEPSPGQCILTWCAACEGSKKLRHVYLWPPPTPSPRALHQPVLLLDLIYSSVFVRRRRRKKKS